MNAIVIIYLIAAPVFVVSLTAHIYVKMRMAPKDDSDFDDYYHEFQDKHPAYAGYQKWSKITFSAAVISALLLFLARIL